MCSCVDLRGKARWWQPWQGECQLCSYWPRKASLELKWQGGADAALSQVAMAFLCISLVACLLLSEVCLRCVGRWRFFVDCQLPATLPLLPLQGIPTHCSRSL
jgi:hypothetical protein